MRRKALSLFLALVLCLGLTVPAFTAGAVKPTGGHLLELSAEPAGSYAFDVGSYLVVEDGTEISCPSGGMEVVRYELDGGAGPDDLFDFLFRDGLDAARLTEQTVPAGQSVAIEGQAGYLITGTVNGESESFLIINRSTMNFAGDSGNQLAWDIPAGSVTMEGFAPFLTTAQPLGYAVVKVDDSGTGTEYYDVVLVFSRDTVISAPEGYLFSCGFTNLMGMGDGGYYDLSVSLSEYSRDCIFTYHISSCGNVRHEKTIKVVTEDFGSSFAELVWLDAEQVDSMSQLVSVWAKPQVEEAIGAGLMTFSSFANLQDNADRTEFAELMVRLYEKVTGETAPMPEENPFEDAYIGYTNDVLQAYALGLIKGTSETTISPYDSLTREQAATIIARLAELLGKPLPERENTFADSGSISDWAAGAVGQVQAAGIMNGVDGNRFDPQGVFTREQCVLTMMRLYELVK